MSLHLTHTNPCTKTIPTITPTSAAMQLRRNFCQRLRPKTMPDAAIDVDDSSSASCSVKLPTWRTTTRRFSNSCGRLGNRWTDYQGMRNWEGLLDPLDETLRSEILRYGRFVDAAYKSFDVDLSSPTYASLVHPKESLLERCGCHDTGYRVTRNLHATSGIRLPRWAYRGPTARMAVRSSWIGYVAVCQNRDEIVRLGRRDVVISYRGTVTGLEWLENIRANLTCFPDVDGSDGGEGLGFMQPMVESGFLSLYTSRTGNRPSLRETVREEVARLVEKYGADDEPLSLTITGHSLGAALAILTAYDLRNLIAQKRVVITVISFGGPRVGNRSFRRRLEEQGVRALRIVNSEDPVTRMPGFVAYDDDDDHNDPHPQICGRGLPGWVAERQRQWVYSDVGKELRLSSRESPYLNGAYDVATCHDLGTYLHLVNEFVSSDCPFRTITADRVLV